MAIWQNIRRLSFSGAVQGVQNPGPVEVLTPVQAVQILDDASSAVAPPRVPRVVVAGAGAAAAVGEFSCIEVQGREGGVWVETLQGNTSSLAAAIWRDDDQATTARAPVPTLTTLGVPNLEAPGSGYFNSRVAALPAFAARYNLTTFETSGLINLFVSPGERLFIANTAANLLVNVTLVCREVPLRVR